MWGTLAPRSNGIKHKRSKSIEADRLGAKCERQQERHLLLASLF
jgi:hypothetical protein